MKGDLARNGITLFTFTVKSDSCFAATHSQGIATATLIGPWAGIHCMVMYDVGE